LIRLQGELKLPMHQRRSERASPHFRLINKK